MTRIRKISSFSSLTLYSIDLSSALALPFFQSLISAGFPSPCDDYLDLKIDLNKQLIDNPSATFFARVTGDSMIDAGIYEGDILIIDRSLEPTDQDIAICYLDGEFTVKRIQKEKHHLYLLPANPAYPPIHITEHNQFLIWGVVTYVIHKSRV